MRISIIDKLLKLRIQESAATLAKLWWLILMFLGGISFIAFSQLTFATDKTIEATVIGMNTTEGIIGKEIFLVVKTDEDVTSEVKAKGGENIGDRITLEILDRIYFRDKYRIE